MAQVIHFVRNSHASYSTKDLNPEIADFGMARIFGGDELHAATRRVVGTYGYMSPEYAMEGRFSKKSDVYSFGVIPLEIVSGMRIRLRSLWKAWKLAPTRPVVGIVVAIKKLKIEGFQGHKEWLAEVNYLGLLRHDNLVKLIGYCSELDNRLLVYEFMPRGNLENHLFRRGVQPISWATRMRITIDVSRGLAFLHNLDKNAIYRDLKDFNAKLSDFGLARDGPTGDNTHVSTRVVGIRGYAAPEYVATGHLTTKSDVYSFGVVLLELLSGKRALDEDKPGYKESLVDWAKPFLEDNRRVLRIMDTRLGGQYSKKQAQAIAGLIVQCLHTDPKNRPMMKELYTTLQELQNSKDNLRRTPNRMEHRGTKHGTHHQKVNNAGIPGIVVDEDALKALKIHHADIIFARKEHKAVQENYETAQDSFNTNYYRTKNVLEALLPLLELSPYGARVVNVFKSRRSQRTTEQTDTKGIL